jgi:hypothetical protein
MITRSAYGHPQNNATQQPTLAALKAMPVGDHVPYEEIRLSDGRVVYYHPTSVLTADDLFVFAPANSQAGRFLLSPGPTVLSLAFTSATADAAVLATLPTGCELALMSFVWNIGVSLTGGSSSAIGVSSGTKTGYTTKGDLLGGASGDVAATLVATGAKYKAGTVGAQFGTNTLRDGAVLVATDTLRFDRITSAFTAGSGNVIVRGVVLANAGA